jgi:methionyl-tRNA formyltransferase
MRVVFVGASKFGLRCFEKALSLPGIEMVGVITNPPDFSISYRPTGVTNVLHRDFHPLAQEHGVPVWNMTGKMTDPDLIEQVKAWAPDFILVVGWYHMIPKAIRSIAPTAGLHASLLPDYSGGAPLVWAMINGETKTGISFFVMEDGVDSGAIIGQAEEPITFEDTIATLYGRIEEVGLKLVETHLPKIADGTATYTVQDESQRRLVPQRSPEDGQIDWHQDALAIYNFVRAQTKPYPGAFTEVTSPVGSEKGKLTLWAVRPIEPSEWQGVPVLETTVPGTLLFDTTNQRVAVACLNQTLLAVYSAQWQTETQTTEWEIPEAVYQAFQEKQLSTFVEEHALAHESTLLEPV